jgi:hypothetical protein
MVDRNELARQIDGLEDVSQRDKERLKQDAGVVDINFEELLDDTQDSTADKR